MNGFVANQAPVPRGLNILIADDVGDTRKLLNWVLRQLDCGIVEEAHNGEEALMVFETLDPAVVFLDIEMPVMNGIETLKRIKEIRPQAFVVIASGFSSMANVKLALDAGANGFVVKPFSISKVGDILRKYAEERASEQ